MLPPKQIKFSLSGAVDGAHFPAGELLLEFFSRAHPHKYPYLSFIFILPPHHHTRGGATGRENFLYRTFCGKIFSWTMGVFFCPVGAGIFWHEILFGNFFVKGGITHPQILKIKPPSHTKAHHTHSSSQTNQTNYYYATK